MQNYLDNEDSDQASQADLSLRWARQKKTFSYVAAQIIFSFIRPVNVQTYCMQIDIS